MGCAGSGVISRAFAKGWRPFAAWPVGVGERGEGVRARSAVGRGVPESESSNALGGHGEKSGVGSVGNVASRASREGEGVHGALGTNLLAVGSKTKWEKYVVGLRARGRVDGDGGGAGGRNSGSAAIYMLGSGIGTLCFRKRTVRVGRKGGECGGFDGSR